MDANKNKENPGGGFRDAFITIISVLIYIAYKLAKGFIGFVKQLAEKGIINCILTIIGAFILIMIAFILLPYIIAPVIVIILAILCLFGLTLLGQ